MDSDLFDAQLAQWIDLPCAQACDALLLGNGASRAVWRNFAYDSLFELAQTVRHKPLGQTDLALFRSLGSESFHAVLQGLNATTRVNAALAISSTSPLNRYYAIKEALIHAVRSVHIPWHRLPAHTLPHLNQALRSYATVYSSNYDLLCHWAVQQQPEGFDDLMDEEGAFDVTRQRSQGTRVFYLHGGLHLLKHLDGSSRQRPAQQSALLDGFAINTPGDVPLFVNEGRSADKLRSIRDSQYLSAALAELSRQQGRVCLFGQHLGADDAHLLQALRRSPMQQLAISIFPLSDAWVRSQKSRYSELFAGHPAPLSFFDATSHPLGAATLNVPVPPAAPAQGRKRR